MGSGAALDELTAFLRARDDAEPAVSPTMRSRVLAGDGEGVAVLLHGLTASPPAWRELAFALRERGRTVVVPRLLLHGHADRMTTALRALDAETLLDDTAAVVARAAQLGGPLTVAGHSLGGTLALATAARLPSVARCVTVAPFLGLAGVPRFLHAPLHRALHAFGGRFFWWDPIRRERLQPEHGYPRYPLIALAVGLDLADRLRTVAHAPPTRAEVTFVLNARESSVSNRAACRLAADWRSAGVAVAIRRLDAREPAHDVVEPDRPQARVVFPELLAILDG